MHLLAPLLLLLSPFLAPARGTIDTVTFRSQALGTTKRYIVYLPPSYQRDDAGRFPVAYYLHGLHGDETNWTALGSLHRTLDSLIATGLPEMILIMPDGDDSWYTTWNFLGDYQGCLTAPVPARPDEEAADYCVPWPHYDDYIARDLVAHVDSSFRTLADRRHRGIAGLSMGGYGAVMLALAYPDVFAAAASHSGVLAPLLVASDSTGGARYARETEAVRSRYPGLWPSQSLAFGRDTAGWWARDPGRRVERLARAGNPAPLSLSPSLALPHLYIDAGSEDPYLSQSRAFRDVLRRLRISHEYRERPGTHDWRYWRENAAHSLAFLARAFAP